MIATRVRKTLTLAVLAVGLASTLQGCGLLLLGGAAGGTLVAVDRRTLGAQTEDREIQIRALKRIGDALPDTAHVNVTVYNRRVLLTGEVPDDAAKQKAESIVRDIINVSGIANELAVQPASSFSSRTRDTYISSKVQAALIGRKDISSNYYKWTTECGIVYLMGLVTVDEGNRGADAVSRVTGVKQVVKLFQYIKPEGAQSLVAAPASGASAASASSAEQPTGVTVGEVSPSGVTSRPLDQQSPAPVSNSAIKPGNPKVPN
ncbi:hypothetical protein DFQ28_010893 [Apophysomyces sp. BC1034]|nr:hypothetical protein DFQ30_000692 [Apophysomyces sp. BC1015]KAG0184571.1 hypothetical protein DFQ28_010893 [Apophysomyces sp. BC1034]